LYTGGQEFTGKHTWSYDPTNKPEKSISSGIQTRGSGLGGTVQLGSMSAVVIGPNYKGTTNTGRVKTTKKRTRKVNEGTLPKKWQICHFFYFFKTMVNLPFFKYTLKITFTTVILDAPFARIKLAHEKNTACATTIQHSILLEIPEDVDDTVLQTALQAFLKSLTNKKAGLKAVHTQDEAGSDEEEVNSTSDKEEISPKGFRGPLPVSNNIPPNPRRQTCVPSTLDTLKEAIRACTDYRALLGARAKCDDFCPEDISVSLLDTSRNNFVTYCIQSQVFLKSYIRTYQSLNGQGMMYDTALLKYAGFRLSWDFATAFPAREADAGKERFTYVCYVH
jgi:hypothetical protein